MGAVPEFRVYSISGLDEGLLGFMGFRVRVC